MRSLLRWGEFYPSRHADIREALFKTLRARYTTLTKSGLPSTSDAALESLQGDDTRAGRFAEKILKWRVVDKVKSTYVDLLDIGDEDTLINPNTKRAHYNWKSFGTVSGRLSCRLQSVPRYSPDVPEERVRELYVPRKRNVFVYFDVSQAEMRLAAYLSGDPVFIRACNGDVHANNAKQVFPEITAKGWLDGEAKKDPARGKPYRDIAKNLGFAIAYGAEADKVFITLRRKGFGISYSAVQVILANLHAAYRVYYKWVAANLAAVEQCGFMRTPILGRIRWLGWHPDLPDVSNFPVQSALADVMNERMISLDAKLPRGCNLVAQIHDACIYDCPAKSASLLENLIKEEWAKEIPLLGGPLVLPIDLKRGDRWSDLG
jgi:DNA polymerase I-like protein with 3'-5' exonuclease and polymerase domains